MISQFQESEKEIQLFQLPMFVYQMHILFLGLLGFSPPFPHRTPHAQPLFILPYFFCLHMLTGTPLHSKLHPSLFGLRSAVRGGRTTITTTKSPCSCRAALLSPFLANLPPASCTASSPPPPQPGRNFWGTIEQSRELGGRRHRTFQKDFSQTAKDNMQEQYRELTAL